MNSFTLTAIGNLARDPQMLNKEELLYSRFCLVATDYAGRDRNGEARMVTSSVWFVAFGVLGEALAVNARKGDQLIVSAQLRANNWIDRSGAKQFGHSFIAQGFRFGAPGKATRDGLAAFARPLERPPESQAPVPPDPTSFVSVA